jgi:proteic killer suppression protein
MEVRFATPRLKAICESEEEVGRVYGEPCARKIITRLADLAAAPTLEEFRHLPGRCRELSANSRHRFALDLTDGKCLIFGPHPHPPGNTDRSDVDWSSVDSVCVVGIAVGGGW